MKYFMFIKHQDLHGQTPPKGLEDAMGAFIGEQVQSGALVDTGGLAPAKDGVRVRSSKGKLSTIDGPFAESKEIIGGYAIVEAKTKEDALNVATKFMEMHRVHWPDIDFECEVRPIEFLLSDQNG